MQTWANRLPPRNTCQHTIQTLRCVGCAKVVLMSCVVVSRCKFGSVVLPGMRVLPELLSVVVDLGSMIVKICIRIAKQFKDNGYWEIQKQCVCEGCVH